VAAVTPLRPATRVLATPARPAPRVLLAGAALIAVVWAVAPPASPPLYDGLSGPADAYKWVNPPPGQSSHGQPNGATKDVPLSGGSNGAAFVTTDESPPQLQVLIGEGALSVPAGATRLTIALKPVQPPSPPIPASLGRLDGNVYEVTLTPDNGGAVSVKSGVTPPTVVLRGPPPSGDATVIRLEPGGSWEKLHTVPLGSAPDMVAASTTAFGYFTLVVSSSSGSGGGGGGSGGGGGGSGGGFPIVAVVVPVAVVVLLGSLLVLVRLSRRTR
jgi:hypothetical protein